MLCISTAAHTHVTVPIYHLEEATISTHVMVISKGYKLRITYFLTFTLTRKQEEATSLEFEICFFPVSLFSCLIFFLHMKQGEKKLCCCYFLCNFTFSQQKLMHAVSVYKLAQSSYTLLSQVCFRLLTFL